MDCLTIGECSYLISLWKICFQCERSIGDEGDIGRMRNCHCHFHLGCPVDLVRQSHSFDCSSLEFKQQLVANHVKKTLMTVNVRSDFWRFMAETIHNFIEKDNSSSLTIAECNHFIMVWRVCFKCETSIQPEKGETNDTYIGAIDHCQCLAHKKCPVAPVRDGHPLSPCNPELRRDLIINYVRKTWNTDDVRNAYWMYMENENLLPELIAIRKTLNDSQKKTDQTNARMHMLEKENADSRKELAESRLAYDELNAESIKLGNENRRLEEVEQKKSQEMRQNRELETDNELSDKNSKEGRRSEKNGVVDTDSDANDESDLKLEMDKFQQLFNELQTKSVELGEKSCSTKNTEMRKDLARKMAATSDTTCEVEDETVNFLSKEIGKLQHALDDLLSSDFQSLPSPFSRKTDDESSLSKHT